MSDYHLHGHGTYICLTHLDYHLALNLAVVGGWQPTGPTPPAGLDDNSAYFGGGLVGYYQHDYQTVTTEDAANMGEALREVLPHLAAERRSSDAIAHFSKPDKQALLVELATLCETSGFKIG